MILPTRFIQLCKYHGACKPEFNKLIHAKSDAEFWGRALANYGWCMDKGILGIANVIQLIRRGADLNVKNNYGNTALILASRYNDLKIVKKLLLHGADINTKNFEGYTPLMIASRNGNLEIVKELLSYGADVNMRDNDGNTALQYALDHDYPEIAQLLKQHGAV